jgi:hypothetical protein
MADTPATTPRPTMLTQLFVRRRVDRRFSDESLGNGTLDRSL